MPIVSEIFTGTNIAGGVGNTEGGEIVTRSVDKRLIVLRIGNPNAF